MEATEKPRYEPLVYRGVKLPWGYKRDPHDKERILPIIEMLELMEEARKHNNAGASLQECARWLSEKTGVKLSKQGLYNRWKKAQHAIIDASNAAITGKEIPKPLSKLPGRKPPAAIAPDDPVSPPAKKTRKVRQSTQERKLSKAAQAAAQAKRSATLKENKVVELLKKQREAKGKPGVEIRQDVVPPLTRVELRNVKQHDAVFIPNPGPQTQFLAASEREVLYGGAAGGGKSYAIIVDPLRWVHFADFRGIIFRRTNDQLRELIFNARNLYKKIDPGCSWAEQKSTFTFSSGAQIWFTYLDRDIDVERYHGQQFSYVGFDELTHWPTPYAWNYMRSRLRNTNPEIPLCMRATTNPSGPGSAWCRAMFVDPAPWGQAFPATDIETGEMLTFPKTDPRYGRPLFSRRFIPAKLSDNPYLFKDGQYEVNLLSLPEAQRRQLLEGDWDVTDGAAFPEFNRKVHVCEPWEIPSSWPRFRSADWGFSSPACVLWFAVDPDNNLWVYRELYTKGKNAEEFAKLILKLEHGERIGFGVLDASAWSSRGEVGPSIAETMNRFGLRWRPSDRSPRSRINGKLELHRRLKVNEESGKPGIKIFNSCVNLIRTLPLLPLDRTAREDVDTDAEDHAYDSARYGVMSRPMNPEYFQRTNHAYTPQPACSVFGY